jgi:hypothetical protein
MGPERPPWRFGSSGPGRFAPIRAAHGVPIRLPNCQCGLVDNRGASQHRADGFVHALCFAVFAQRLTAANTKPYRISASCDAAPRLIRSGRSDSRRARIERPCACRAQPVSEAASCTRESAAILESARGVPLGGRFPRLRPDSLPHEVFPKIGAFEPNGPTLRIVSQVGQSPARFRFQTQLIRCARHAGILGSRARRR